MTGKPVQVFCEYVTESELGSTSSTCVFVWYFKYRYLKYKVLEMLKKFVYFHNKCILSICISSTFFLVFEKKVQRSINIIKHLRKKIVCIFQQKSA